MDPDYDELLAELSNRRGEDVRVGKSFPARLNEQMVRVVNLSPTGARLIVQGGDVGSPPYSLKIDTGDGEIVELQAEPKWEEKLGDSAIVIGLAFPQNQPGIQALKERLEPQTN